MAPQVVAIGGGKGGVGKSLVAANVGIFLATLGKRVDPRRRRVRRAEPAHLRRRAAAGAHAVARRSRPHGPPLAELAVATHVPGRAADRRRLRSAVDRESRRPTHGARARASSCASCRPTGSSSISGPGSRRATLELFLEADIGLLVAVPDPTSIELMHRFVRAAFLAAPRAPRARRTSRSSAPPSARDHEGGTPSALDIYLARGRRRRSERRRAARRDPRLLAAPRDQLGALKSDMELGRAVASAARRRLGTPIRYLGHLEYDEAVWASTRRRRPLLDRAPRDADREVLRARRARPARGAAAATRRRRRAAVATRTTSCSRSPPTASFEDIRRANRRIRDVYGAESIAVSAASTIRRASRRCTAGSTSRTRR